MTTELKNKPRSVALHNGILNIKANKTWIGLITGLHLLAVPTVLIAMAVVASTGKGDYEGFIYIGIITTIIAGLLGIFIVMNNFDYLFKKKKVDMIYSLPISKRDKFFSDYLSGLIAYIAPFISVQILSSILLGIFHLVFDGKEFPWINENNYKLQQGRICDIFETIAPYYFKLLLIGIVVMIMLYTITVLISVFCGNLFESSFYTIITNIAIPSVFLIFTDMIHSEFYGVVAVHKIAWLFYSLSPIGLTLGGIFRILSAEHIFDILLFGLLFSAIFLVTAYFLYKKRKSEQVGKPFAFKGLYYVLLSTVILTLVISLLYNEVNVVITLIIALCIHFALEMISNRGIKRFWLMGIRFVAFVGSACLIIWISKATDGFYSVKYIPSANNVEKISILEDDMSIYRGSTYSLFDQQISSKNFLNDICIVLDDKDSINLGINFHKQVIDDYNKYKDKNSVYDENDKLIYRTVSKQITIAYHMKNGQKITREYTNISTEALLEFEKIKYNDTYKKGVMKRISNEFNEYFDSFYSRTMFDGFDNSTELYNTLRFTVRGKWSGFDDTNKYYYKLYKREFFDEFLDAYFKDYSEDTYEKAFAGYNDRICITFGNNTFNIPTYYSNTLYFLNKYSIEIPSNMNFNGHFTINNGENNITGTNKTISLLSSYYYYAQDYSYNAEFNYYPNHPLLDENAESYYFKDYHNDILTLLEVARIGYITEEKCYTISVSDTLGIIPPEYNDVAKRVYDRAISWMNADKNGIALDEY